MQRWRLLVGEPELHRIRGLCARSRQHLGFDHIDVTFARHRPARDIQRELHLRLGLGKARLVAEALTIDVRDGKVRHVPGGRAFAAGLKDGELKAELATLRRPQMPGVVPPLDQRVVRLRIGRQRHGRWNRRRRNRRRQRQRRSGRRAGHHAQREQAPDGTPVEHAAPVGSPLGKHAPQGKQVRGVTTATSSTCPTSASWPGRAARERGSRRGGRRWPCRVRAP